MYATRCHCYDSTSGSPLPILGGGGLSVGDKCRARYLMILGIIKDY